MKLLLIGPLPPPYIGPAIATERLLNSPVLRSRFDIVFLDTRDPGGSEDIGQLSARNIRMALKHGSDFLSLLARTRPDVVYVPIARGLWGFIRDLLFLIPARFFGATTVVHLRAGRFDLIHDHGWFGRAVARLGLASVSRAIVLGETLRDVFGSSVSAKQIYVVPNGMNLEGWTCEEWEAERRQSSEVRISYLANLYEDKGAHVMLAAIPRIVQAVPNLKVRFAGDTKNRAFLERCHRIVAEQGIERHVEFIGEVNDGAKKRLLAESDISVFTPIKPEGLPWVILEAMSAGLPVVGTPQGTMKEVIVDGSTGYLVPSGDAEALAERVIRLALDPELRRELGRNGRARVERIYAEPVTHRLLADAIAGLEPQKVAGR